MPAIAIDEISIPPRRQRQDVGDINELADSIRRLGLIHPIVIDRSRILVAGGRRLSACKTLGWTHIPTSYTDELDPLVLHLIELEENVKRKDLTWQERHEAIIEYHRLRAEADPKWTEAATGSAIGLTQQAVNKHMVVEKFKDHALVKGADTLTTAAKTATRLAERKAADEFDVHSQPDGVCTQPSIINADCSEWIESYDGPRFNLLHCDFPYGIDSHNSGQNPSGYEDDVSSYFHLLRSLATSLDRICAASAHIIFWFSPTHIGPTWELLKLLDGFKFDEHPLIWHKSDQRGIVPDPQRRPRRMYETAFFGWRNDRKLVRLKNNIVAAPSSNEHPHAKPVEVLTYFFEMVTDEHTTLFDPTVGSGNSLIAALQLGASRVLGIERDPAYFADAERALRNSKRRQDRIAESLQRSAVAD